MASIKERNGSFQITVSLGRDIYGKKLMETTTFRPDPGLTPKKREKAVQEFAADFERRVKNGQVLEGSKTTLKEFSDRWFREFAPQKLQPGTVEAYRKEMDKILPTLGHLKLTELRPVNLNAFFLSMTKDGARADGKLGGYSKATIKKTQDVLSSILRTAAEWEVLERNPMDKVRAVGEIAAEKIKFFTPEQASAFLEYLDQPQTVKVKGHSRTDDTGIKYRVGDYEITKEVPEQFRVLYNLAVYTGLRKGELLALEWSDIDFENNTVKVSKACSVVAGEQITKCPKTKTSNRTVSIPSFLTRRLKAMKISRLAYRLSLGDYWQGADWVFIQDNGRQMNYSTPNQTMVKLLKRYNDTHDKTLPLIPFHGLRHTSATLLIAAKQDVRSVSSRLGHAQTSTTMNIYAHALQEADQRAANALESMLLKQA